MAQSSPEEEAAFLPLSNQVNRLTSPAEMGELFKVIAVGSGHTNWLLGFAGGDRRHSL
jgi:SAM-dependent MidA family methyltransferase